MVLTPTQIEKIKKDARKAREAHPLTKEEIDEIATIIRSDSMYGSKLMALSKAAERDHNTAREESRYADVVV